jgi:hypothetical protein
MAAVKALYVGLFDCWLNAFRPALVGHPTSKTYDLGNGLLGRLRAGLESFAHVLWTLQTSSETPLTTPSSSLIHQHGLDRIAMNENDLWEESRVEMLTLLRDAVQAVSGQGGRLKAEQKPAETPVQSAYEARKANAKPKGTKKKPFANFAAWARAKMNERKFPTSFSIEQDSGGRLNHKTIDKILRGEMTKESTRERFCEVLNDIAPGFEPIFLRDAPAD